MGRPRTNFGCIVDGCDNKASARGYCHAHYYRLKRTGDLKESIPVSPYGRVGCLIEGCVRAHAAHGYCAPHNARTKRNGSPTGGRHVPGSFGSTCNIDGCEKPHASSGLCTMHLARVQRHGDHRAWMSTVLGDHDWIERTLGRCVEMPPPDTTFAPMLPEGAGPCLIVNGIPEQRGRLQIGDRNHGRTYRRYWEAVVGPIPGSLVIDHLCRRPGCIAIRHLEPVTQSVNAQRGFAAWRMRRDAAEAAEVSE